MAEGRFLDDYARELAGSGERAFRQRYVAPVLIVSGRAERTPPRDTGEKTATDRPGLHGLVNRVFPLLKAAHTPMGPVVVGRVEDGDVDVVVPDASISRRHCAFVAQPAAWAVMDLGSRNGTAVNRASVAPQTMARLAGGETITIGGVDVTFETPSGFAELVGSLGSG